LVKEISVAFGEVAGKSIVACFLTRSVDETNTVLKSIIFTMFFAKL